MKHNGLVPRIPKTSSSALATNAGGVSVARPVSPAEPSNAAGDEEMESLLASLRADLSMDAKRTPAFATRMEREIADLLASGNVTTGMTLPGVPPPAPPPPDDVRNAVTARPPGRARPPAIPSRLPFEPQVVPVVRLEEEAEDQFDRPAIPGPPPLPPAAVVQAHNARIVQFEKAAKSAERAPVPATPRARPAERRAPVKRSTRVRLRAAALGIATGLAISMVLTWHPEKPAPDAAAFAACGAGGDALVRDPVAPAHAAPLADIAPREAEKAPSASIPGGACGVEPGGE